MTIHEYGDRDRPHVLLIHGMWMCHEMMLPFVEGFQAKYHIIAPDLTGHGEDRGLFLSAKHEAEQIGKWLMDNGIREIDLMFSSSLGGVVAMYLVALARDIRVNCSVMEGASLTRVRGAQKVFYWMLKGMRDHPERLKKYSVVPLMDAPLMDRLFEAMKRTDDESLRNMVTTCNSFDFEHCPLHAKAQKGLFFEFGSRDSHIVCRYDIKRFYPNASLTVRKGYGHCTYMFEHVKEYPAILREYMRKAEVSICENEEEGSKSGLEG